MSHTKFRFRVTARYNICSPKHLGCLFGRPSGYKAFRQLRASPKGFYKCSATLNCAAEQAVEQPPRCKYILYSIWTHI